MKLPVTKTHNLDIPDQQLYIRLIEGEDFLIELLNVEDKTIREKRENMDPYELIGFNKIMISGANASFEEDPEGNFIVEN